MEIRTKLNGGEILDDEDSYEKFFLGECFGVGLKKRNLKDEDPHVCFVILGEDDERWSECYDFASSYWLPDLAEAITAAQAWMEKHCKKDGQYGYKFY